MPARSKVAMLPQAVRDELERRILENAFSGYQELAEWLQEQGYQIADDSVQRYGARLHERIESLDLSVQQAKAIAHADPADRDSIVDSTIHLLNAQVFSTLLETEQIEQDDIARLSRTVCQLSRISIARQKWAQEMNSILNPEQRNARERRAKTARAEAFAAVQKALLDPKAFKQDDASAGPLNADIFSAAESPTSGLGETGPAGPQTPSK
jgi:hypothetical protein